MKRITFAVILTIVSVLFSGYANAMVAHPENTDIVGALFFGNTICFNNDGAIANESECNQSGVDEGMVYKFARWGGDADSGINGCGTGAVDPVSSATCPLTYEIFDTCTNDGYVLVQTTKSGHFWTVKSDSSCIWLATPETTALVPCLLSDAFDPVTGCSPGLNPPVMTIEKGYIQLNTYSEGPPPSVHCDDPAHDGRMVVDSVNGLIYICTQAGWIAK